uniref:Uncharacterized protein n=1 Tax=Plectus sambesii TaxID=2011161 RepID=A0A914UTE7_9BILA
MKHKNADFLSRLHEDETEGDEDRPPAPGVGEKFGSVLLTQTANAVSLSNDIMQPVVSSLDVSSELAPRSSSNSEPASHCFDSPPVLKRGRPRGSKRRMPVSDQPVRQRHSGLRARLKQQPVTPGFVRW